MSFLGRALLLRVVGVYALWDTTVSSFSCLLRFDVGRKATLRVLLKQVYFTAFEAVPIISRTAFILGLIIVTETLSLVPGSGAYIGDVLVWVVVREVGPLLAAVIVAARSGSAIAAELGTMKLTREVTSLEVMGIDPVRYLVMPRVIGVSISLFVLTFYFEAVSIIGGFAFLGFSHHITLKSYMERVFGVMGFKDMTVSLLKSSVFGLVIGAHSSSRGLQVEGTITRVPQETTRAVIGGLGWVFLANAVITFVFFMR